MNMKNQVPIEWARICTFLCRRVCIFGGKHKCTWGGRYDRIDVQIHTHMNKEYKDADKREIGSCGQGRVYSDRLIDYYLK